MKNLTALNIDKGNILNNNFASSEIYTQAGFAGVTFESEYRFTKNQLLEYFQVDERTITRYLQSNRHELTKNGRELLSGARLKQFKEMYGKNINVFFILHQAEN